MIGSRKGNHLLEKARRFREIGYSYKELAEQLGISKSTAFLWTSDITVEPHGIVRLQNRIADARVRSGHKKHLTKERGLDQIASTEKEYLRSLNPSSISGRKYARVFCALIYWCEGAKNDGHVSFTNSDPLLVKFFINIFKDSFPLDPLKFRVKMHLHSYHSESAQKVFWSEITGIPESQFHKAYIKPNTGKNKRPNYPGCVTVVYYDTWIARQLLTLARLAMQN